MGVDAGVRSDVRYSLRSVPRWRFGRDSETSFEKAESEISDLRKNTNPARLDGATDVRRGLRNAAAHFSAQNSAALSRQAGLVFPLTSAFSDSAFSKLVSLSRPNAHLGT
jgi:hypothetical protein